MVKLKAPADLYVAALGDDVAAGDEVEVDDELGDRLLEQGWTLHTSSGSRKAAAPKAPKAPGRKRAPKRAALKAAGTDTDTDTGPAPAGPDTSSAPADDPEV